MSLMVDISVKSLSIRVTFVFFVLVFNSLKFSRNRCQVSFRLREVHGEQYDHAPRHRQP